MHLICNVSSLHAFFLKRVYMPSTISCTQSASIHVFELLQVSMATFPTFGSEVQTPHFSFILFLKENNTQCLLGRLWLSLFNTNQHSRGLCFHCNRRIVGDTGTTEATAAAVHRGCCVKLRWKSPPPVMTFARCHFDDNQTWQRFEVWWKTGTNATFTRFTRCRWMFVKFREFAQDWAKVSINQSNFICIAHIHEPQFVS